MFELSSVLRIVAIRATLVSKRPAPRHRRRAPKPTSDSSERGARFDGAQSATRRLVRRPLGRAREATLRPRSSVVAGSQYLDYEGHRKSSMKVRNARFIEHEHFELAQSVDSPFTQNHPTNPIRTASLDRIDFRCEQDVRASIECTGFSARSQLVSEKPCPPIGVTLELFEHFRCIE